MTENEPTKDLTEQLTDRQILLELRQTMAAMAERMSELERRTNPLPPNYDARFTALEQRVDDIVKSLADFKSETNRNFKILRDDVFRVRQEHAALEERMDALEQRPS